MVAAADNRQSNGPFAWLAVGLASFTEVNSNGTELTLSLNVVIIAVGQPALQAGRGHNFGLPLKSLRPSQLGSIWACWRSLVNDLESIKPMPEQPATELTSPSTLREIDSSSLLQGEKEILIHHGDEVYRLRLTKNGKLILQK